MISTPKWLAVLAFVGALGCGSRPGEVAAPISSSALVISDQVHDGGTPGFFFLFPTVPQPRYSGTFRGDQQPVVTIEELPPGTRGLLATYTTSGGPYGGRVFLLGESYNLLWPTAPFQLGADHVYRIRVSVRGLELGFADVDVVKRIRDLLTVDTNEYVPLLDDLILPVRFRIETQALACVGVACPASDPCHEAGVCDPRTGACTWPAKPDGRACDDGDACTRVDTCQVGVCVGASRVTCSLGDQCRDVGNCDPATGACSNPPKPDGTPCDDGDLCTLADACQLGACASGSSVTCAAQDPCHEAGVCDPVIGFCSNPRAPDGVACEDASACTRVDTCLAGVCTGSDLVTCQAADPCHLPGACDPLTGTCSNPRAPDSTPCNDGDACTEADSCQQGTCLGSPILACGKPQAPTLVGVPGDRRVDLYWSAVRGAATYNLYRGDPSTPLQAGIVGTSASDQDGLLNGVAYTYTVTAVNGHGESDHSNSVVVTPTVPPKPPARVAAVGLNGGVRVLWDPPSGAGADVKYTVYRRAVSGQPGAEWPVAACSAVSGGSGPRRSCTALGEPFLNHSGTHILVVRATTGGLESADSDEASAAPARELCVSLPDMGAVAAIDADTPVTGGAVVDVVPRRWFGNLSQLAAPSAVAVDAAGDALLVANQDASSIVVYSPRSAAGNAAPVRSLTSPSMLQPVGMVLDPVAHEIFVVNQGGGVRLAVFNQSAAGVSVPKRAIGPESLPYPPTAIALGPGSDEITVTDGTTIYVFPRTWAGTKPPVLAAWGPVQVQGAGTLSDLVGIATDHQGASGSVWAVSGSLSATVVSIPRTAPSGPFSATPLQSFSLPSRALSVAYDPIGDGTTPYLFFGLASSAITAYRSDASTGASPVPGYPVTTTNLNYLTGPVSLATDTSPFGDNLVVVNRGSSATRTYRAEQSVATYSRLGVGYLRRISGPFQGSSPACSDEPTALATSPLNDELWVVNQGLPGGSPSGTCASRASVYEMTTGVLTGAPSSVVWLDTASLGSGWGVAVNDDPGADEVYVSDGGSSVAIFPRTGGGMAASAGVAAAAATGLLWLPDSSGGSGHLLVADQGGAALRVLRRVGANAFLEDNPLAPASCSGHSSCLAGPTGIAAAVAGATNRLWVVNSSTLDGDPGPLVVRIDPSTGISDGSYLELRPGLTPSAVAADATSVYIGTRSPAMNEVWGISVLTGSLEGTPSGLGVLRVQGVTHNVGGLIWCN